eukprot:5340438-Pleurochrysis_carterae.AAC.1
MLRRGVGPSRRYIPCTPLCTPAPTSVLLPRGLGPCQTRMHQRFFHGGMGGLSDRTDLCLLRRQLCRMLLHIHLMSLLMP